MISQQQARIAAAALVPRIQALEELLAQQIQLLPPGNSDWATTREQLELENGAYMALHNLGVRQ